MNPNNEIQRDRLFRAMDSSYRVLEPFRSLVRGLVEEYAGSGYGNAAARPRLEILLNLMEQAVGAYTMTLAANRPRVLVTAKSPDKAYFARQFQVAMNNLAQEICLEQTLQRAVLDAFFCVGFVKMHMASSIPVMVEEGVWMDPGIPFASNVSMDNFVYDTTASEWQKVKFSADSYRIPFDDLKADFFNQDVVAQLTPTSKMHANEDERLEMISRGYETDNDELYPMIDLMDVWDPVEKMIFTFAMEPNKRFTGRFGPLAEMEWTGHEFGCHKFLSFARVPENVMPFGPASQLSGLSRLANNILRKQGRQARRQKDIHTYTAAGAKAASRAKSASDGDMIEVNDTGDLGILKFGGVDAGNQAFFVSLVDLFDRAAGNLSAILGLGAQAETLGQEQLIHGAANQKIASMQFRVADFTRSVVRDLGHLLWNDQVKVIPGRVEIPGATGYSVDATWTPTDREGDVLDYDLDIDVHSMPYRSPMQRLQSIDYVLNRVFVPLMPILVQQGGTINMQSLTEIYAELTDEPRLKDIIQFAALPPEEMMEAGGKPSNTSREYVRRSVASQGTPQGKAQVQQQAWLAKAGSQGGQE